jgi:hypothetical protein
MPLTRCRHLDRGSWRDVRGAVAIDYQTGDAVFRPSPKGNVIRTHCEKCGGFVGYRPAERRKGTPL